MRVLRVFMIFAGIHVDIVLMIDQRSLVKKFARTSGGKILVGCSAE